MLRTELDLAEERARAVLGRWEHRLLGVVRPDSAAEFARAAGETAPRLTDPRHPGFRVHPLYVVSLLRAEPGAEATELRPDGMYRDEVPGTDGLGVRLMAGGQRVRWIGDVRPGDRIELRRALTDVRRKGEHPGSCCSRSRRPMPPSAAFSSRSRRGSSRDDRTRPCARREKTYAAERGVLVEVTERFIAR